MFLVIVPTENVHIRKPGDYVVVENNHHQLPIGFVQFIGTEDEVYRKSIARRNRLRELHIEAERLEKKLEEAKVKTNIIQLMIQNEIDTASHKYQKYLSLLTEQSREEIVLFALGRSDFDHDFIPIYFPGVEYNEVTRRKTDVLKNIQSLESQEQMAIQARKNAREAEENARKKAKEGDQSVRLGSEKDGGAGGVSSGQYHRPFLFGVKNGGRGGRVSFGQYHRPSLFGGSGGGVGGDVFSGSTRREVLFGGKNSLEGCNDSTKPKF